MASFVASSSSLHEETSTNYRNVSFNPSTSKHIKMDEEHCWRPPPDPAWPIHNYSHTETYTHHPSYSIDPDALYSMINQQALYPPAYYVQIHGKHNEKEQSESKKSGREITDFYFRINISHLLGPRGSGQLEIPPNNKRAYRGTRFPSLKPSLSDPESRDALFVWCEKYVSDSSKIKSFTLCRKIRNHNTQKLYQLIKSAISETRYQGQVYITFPSTHCKVVVYSPSRINKWRTTLLTRWLFYLTFLWIMAWPLLIFLTRRYEMVSSVFYFADSPDIKDLNRKCKVCSEVEWFLNWKSAIKRAVLTGINIGESALTDEYRIEVNQRKNADAAKTIVPFATTAFDAFAHPMSVSTEYDLIDMESNS